MACKLVLPCNEIYKLSSFPKSYDDLLCAIQARLQENPLKPLVLKYMDADKELVNLTCDEDLQTAILSNEAEKIKTLKVYVFLREGNPSPSKNISLGKVFRKSRTFPADKLKIDELDEVMSEECDIPENTRKSPQNPQWNTSYPPAAGLNRFSLPTKINNEQIWSSVDVCSVCKRDIKLVKYTCLQCPNYKSCEPCEEEVHHVHSLLKVKAFIGSYTCSRSHPMSPIYRFIPYISPRKVEKRTTHIFVQKKSLGNGTQKSQTQYSGTVTFQGCDDQKIKVEAATDYEVKVTIRNTGTEIWPRDVRLSCVNGTYRTRQEALVPLEPGAQYKLTLNLISPTKPGKYLSQWRLYYEDGDKARSFGESLFLDIQVEPKELGEANANRKKEESLSLKNNSSLAKETLDTRKDRECKVKSEGGLNKKHNIAMYLNEIFPGSLEEKVKFLDENFSEKEVNVQKIVEIYLYALTKRKSARACKAEEMDSSNTKEMAVTLL